MEHFSQKKLRKFYVPRAGETRLGDTIQLSSENWEEAIINHQGDFVLFGIPEDLGPVANMGIHGTNHAFEAFLEVFLKIQDNRFLCGEEILLLGEISCFDLLEEGHKQESNSEEGIKRIRELVAEIDSRVLPVVEAIVSAGKIPIAIGGGHNNAYPMLKGTSKALDVPVQCINIDPHADLREKEGRHSGNGFRYALDDAYLTKYFVLGLHESYNNNAILSLMEKDERINYLTFEHYIQNDLSVEHLMKETLTHIKTNYPVTLEVDLDSFPLVPTSAETPVGLPVNEALKLVCKFSEIFDIKYLNISEGIPREHFNTGKLIAYFVTTFIKATKQKLEYK